jgi:large subunit ribosomal protein L4
VVLDELKIDDPKTKPVLALLESLGATDGVLIVTAGTDRVAMKSANNLQGVSVLAAPLLNPLRAVGARNIIITRDAVRRVDEIWAEPQSRPARKLAAACGTPSGARS